MVPLTSVGRLHRQVAKEHLITCILLLLSGLSYLICHSLEAIRSFLMKVRVVLLELYLLPVLICTFHAFIH